MFVDCKTPLILLKLIYRFIETSTKIPAGFFFVKIDVDPKTHMDMHRNQMSQSNFEKEKEDLYFLISKLNYKATVAKTM